MSDHLHPWAAIAHEDAPAEPALAAQPAAAAPKPVRPKAEPKADASIPIAMALMVPPDLAAAITSLVETQAALTKRLGDLVDGIGKMLAANATPPPADTEPPLNG